MLRAQIMIFIVCSTFGLTMVGADEKQPSCCLCGKKVCVLKVSEGKEKVVRFEVESKEICIPGIKLPWDKCGTRRCGGVRKVCVLKEVSQEKTVCEYDWSIKVICTGCCQQHRLKHHSATADQPQLNEDPKFPFAYYSVDPVVQEETIHAAGALLMPATNPK